MSQLTFTLVQTALRWEDKEANLEMLEKKIASVKGKTQVVVLPEMFSTGFSMKPESLAEGMNGETVRWMRRVATENRVIVTGSVIIKEGQTGRKGQRGGAAANAFTDGADSASGPTVEMAYYNRLIWMLPNGQAGYYNKRHLFAFAGEDKHYTAGTERLIASANGWRINLQVCYDLRFPVWARQTPSGAFGSTSPQGEGRGEAEYDALIYVANWPQRRSTAWKTLLQARAIENQCYVIGVNRVGEDGNNIYHSGDSMVVDPLGEVLYHKQDEEDEFTVTLDKKHLQEVRERFPFWRDGDGFRIEA